MEAELQRGGSVINGSSLYLLGSSFPLCVPNQDSHFITNLDHGLDMKFKGLVFKYFPVAIQLLSLCIAVGVCFIAVITSLDNLSGQVCI